MKARGIMAALWAAASVFGAIEGPSPGGRGGGNAEDSLQTLLQEDPENFEHWLGLGRLAVRDGQDDLAKGYFDEAIKISKNAADPILRIGSIWLEAGKVETSLPYLIPNLTHIKTESLLRLSKALEEKRHSTAAILVLRHVAGRGKGYSPEIRRAAEIAFRSGQHALSRDILAAHAAELDTGSARLMLLAGFYAGGPLSVDAIGRAQERVVSPEARALAALNHAQQGNFRAVRAYLENPGAAVPPPVRGFLRAQELVASDQIREAAEFFEQALESNWPEFRLIAYAELYKFFSITGNRYKADQLWNDIRERELEAGQKEFLARHLALRRYEKQAGFLYRSLYRSHPGRPAVIKALWDELVNDDPDALGGQIKTLLASDPLDCDANQLAMRYFKFQNQNREVVHHGRNVVLYCHDVVEPYFDLATALLSLSKPQEARTYFGKFVKSGGDKTRIPTYMR